MSGSNLETVLIESLMPPPWMRFPGFPQACIGWRMGGGEDYVTRFWPWYRRLSADQQDEYQRLFPAPKTWLLAYVQEWDEDAWLAAEEGLFCVSSAYAVLYWEKAGVARYTRDWLIRQGAGDEPTFVAFWKPGEPDSPACLGQWQPSAFFLDGDRYSCAEQYMMAEKARLFADNDAEHRIMATDDPATMKRLGKQVHGFDPAVWDQAKYPIVLNGNYAKFTQDDLLRRYLLSTGDAVLVEASPLDTIWGIGLGAANERLADPSRWRGQNLLGFALMEVRDEIARVWANTALIDWTQYPTNVDRVHWVQHPGQPR